jgi:hypothetical protein
MSSFDSVWFTPSIMLFNLSPIISNILVCGEGGGSVNGGCEFGVSTHSGVVEYH